ADVINVSVPDLHLGVPLTTTLDSGEDRLYQIAVGLNQTMRVDLTSSSAAAANELYLSYNAVPTGSVHDAAYQGPLQANQSVTIPLTKAGTYYLLVRRPSEPPPGTSLAPP